VAKRVRCLRVNPNFSQDFASTPGMSGTAGRGAFWTLGVNAVRRLVRELPVSANSVAETSEAAPMYNSSQQSLIQTVVDTVSHLSEVNDLDVSWWEPANVRHLYPFLPVAWKTFGANLKTLTLTGSLEGLGQLASSSTPFVALQNLNLEFVHNVHSTHDVSDTRILVDVIAHFVNGLSPTLQHLSITSWAALELSSFFSNLHSFPQLRVLIIRVSFNKAFPSECTGLSNLLHNHSNTLKSVALRFNPLGLMAQSSSEEPLVHWMTEIAADQLILANLQTLQIYPTLLPGGFDAFLVYLRRSVNTLTLLTVRDRYFSYDEVDRVVASLTMPPPDKRLKYLRLNVHNLSARLLDLLADSFPFLWKLTLIVGEGWTESEFGESLSTPVRIHIQSIRFS
jgi:hypothetical protein